MYKCLCGREFESPKSYSSHTKWCKEYCNTVNREVAVSSFTTYNHAHTPWNKGLTKETDSRIKCAGINISRALTGKCGRSHTPETIRKISETMKSKSSKGELHGFMRRGKESYPEKFWSRVLDKNNIPYIREYRVSFLEFGIAKPYAGYFLDFYIEDLKLDIEIDGSQHIWDSEVVKKDQERDRRLSSVGYKIYRIPYIDPRHSDRVREQIDEFLEYYKSLKTQ